MHILKVFIQGVGESIMLRFKTNENANYWYNLLHNSREMKDGIIPLPVDVKDDFGMNVRISPYGILLVQKIDFMEAMIGDAMWQFHQKKINDDTILKLSRDLPVKKNT